MKPCPFCGSKRLVSDNLKRRTHTDYFVTCQECGANGPAVNRFLLGIDYWNMRRIPNSTAKQIRDKLDEYRTEVPEAVVEEILAIIGSDEDAEV